MQEIIKENRSETDLINLSPEDKQKLVDVFAWLIQEDKKQNPAFYQLNK